MNPFTLCAPYTPCEHILYVGGYVFLIGIIVIINRLLQRTRKIHPEITRKTPHILGGFAVMHGAIVLPKVYVLLLLSVLFLIALVSYRNKKRFPAVYAVSRKSFGTVLYPLTLLVLAAVLLPESRGAFLYGASMMIFVDGLTAVIGSIFGKKIPVYEKSILGSTTFFILGASVGIMFGVPFITAIIFSAVVAAHEFFIRWGLDNFTIPVLSVLLWLLFL